MIKMRNSLYSTNHPPVNTPKFQNRLSHKPPFAYKEPNLNAVLLLLANCY